jgi:peptidyl-Lys metalloendopeptidase
MTFGTSLKRWLNLSLAVFLIACALPAASAVTARGALQTELSTVDAAGDHRVTVRFTFRNISHEDLYILAYETPFRGFERDLFVVERDGERIPYIGMVAFRAGPMKDDWVQLAPGAEISEVLDISSAYDTSRGGTYTVRYNAVQQIFRGIARDSLPVVGTQASTANQAFAGEGVSSDPISVTISGPAEVASDVDPFVAPRIPPDAGSRDHGALPLATFGCQSPSVISSAQTTARSRALRAANAATTVNTWYRTWFGNTSSAVSTVRSRFTNAYNRLGQNVDYLCGANAPQCSAGIVAYTFKQTSNRMYLCSAFWSYSNKGHVVGHEAYHWNTVAGADDVTYGSSQCQSLARSRPNDALRNSDNYAYAADTAP